MSSVLAASRLICDASYGCNCDEYASNGRPLKRAVKRMIALRP